MSSSRDLYSENRHYSRIIMDEPDDDEIEVVKVCAGGVIGKGVLV